MADQLVFLVTGDPSEAQRILDAFAGETGLAAEPAEDGTRFALDGADHQIKVVETLNGIEPEWSRHLSLGAPDARG
jgi:hypothetical protein